MENEDQEDMEQVVPSAAEEEEVEVVEAPADAADTSEQDPLKTELEKVQRKGRTKTEKLLYTKKRIDEQVKELGLEDEPLEDEDDQPVTLGMLKKFQGQTATKTALQLADDVSNETERELLKFHIENTIKSTGNAQQDFDLASTLVNAVKNKQIMEQATIKPQTSSHSSGPGAPAKVNKPQDDLTVEEMVFTKPPFNMTKEAILATRPK